MLVSAPRFTEGLGRDAVEGPTGWITGDTVGVDWDVELGVPRVISNSGETLVVLAGGFAAYGSGNPRSSKKISFVGGFDEVL